MTLNTHESLRKLPGVDSVLNDDRAAPIIDQYGRELVVKAARAILESWRIKLLAEQKSAPTAAEIVEEIPPWLEMLLAPTLSRVINATGVIVHTNLGRSPIESGALKCAEHISSGYSTLEYNTEKGARGSRTIHAEKLLTMLTGAESALVVNNNAAAVLLMLTALCRGKEVIISRGELIEIGGGFRIPDVLQQSGAEIVEVGTTNKTHLSDYQNAISERTGAILVAHQSNFRIVGFTSAPELKELSDIARSAEILLLYDQGSGAVRDLSQYGLMKESTVQEILEGGADIVAFSGDKLLGGPQAGILVGKKELIADAKRHPLARAVRSDKLSLAVLSKTLQSYVTGQENTEIPVWKMISRSMESIEDTAQEWVGHLTSNGVRAKAVAGQSTIGGGSLPGSVLPTMLVSISVDDVERLAMKLRQNDPPIIGRISGNQLLIDPRTVLPAEGEQLLHAVSRCAAEGHTDK